MKGRFFALSVIALLCAFLLQFTGCFNSAGSSGGSSDQEPEPPVDYGTLNLSLPAFNREDGENVLFANYGARKIKLDFSKPEYATDDLEWTVEDEYADRVKVENDALSAIGDFSQSAEVKVSAKGAHHEAEFTVTVKNFEGQGINGSLELESRACIARDRWLSQSVDGKGETGGTLFVGDSFFDPVFFANVETIYRGKNVCAVGIGGTTSTDWQYLAERLIYPAAPANVVIHAGTNDLFDDEKRSENASADIVKLFEQIHAELPEANIYWFGIEPRVGREETRLKQTNVIVARYCADNDWITYIDSASWFYNQSGEIDETMYRDGIHPKLEKYYLYTQALAENNISISDSVYTGVSSDLPEIESETIAENSATMTGSVPLPGNKTRAGIRFDARIAEGSVIRFMGDADLFKWAVVTFPDEARKTNYDSSWNTADNWKGDENRLTYTLNANVFVTLTVAYHDNREIPQDVIDDLYSMFKIYGGFLNGEAKAKTEREVNSVNHRGYNVVAPENTLAAFRLSKEKGFSAVECDVSFTKDGVPVLLHDSTVDRTSNGTGKIGDLTFDEVRALDFGSWKSADYAGEKIPSLEEFAALCKELGLHAYIELKTDGTTADQVAAAYRVVNEAGISDNVTWISFGYELLEKVKETAPEARLGFVVNSVNEKTVEICRGLKNGANEVFVDCNVDNATAYTIKFLKTAGIPLEVWTVNGESVIAGLDKYVSGFTSNSLNAQSVLKALTSDRKAVTVSALPCENGTIGLSAGRVLDGESVTVTIAPAEGYLVSSIKINGEEKIGELSGDSISFVADGDSTVEAVFAPESEFVLVTYHIGTETVQKRVKKGSEFLYVGTPEKADEGIKYYEFVGWFTGADSDTEVIDFVFENDADLYAKFEERSYSFAINYQVIDIDTVYGEKLVAITGYKGEIEWRVTEGDAVSVDANGDVTATAAGSAKIGLFADGEQMAECAVTATEGNKELMDGFVAERTNVYRNLNDGTRALLQSNVRFDAGLKITLKTQYRDSYQWSVSQLYMLPAKNGYLMDPGWNVKWTDTSSYTTTESSYPAIVVAVKGNTGATLPVGLENNLKAMFTVGSAVKDSGYIALSDYIARNSIETIKVIGTKDAVVGGTVNNKRVSVALKTKVGAGTKIRFNVHTAKYLFAVVELQSLESTANSTDSGWNSTWKSLPQKLVYTVKKDSYVCLTMAVPGGKNALTQTELDLLDTVFDISPVAAAEATE